MRRRTLAMTGALAVTLTLAWPSAAVAAAPTATIVVDDTVLSAGESSLVTFTFSEAVDGFTAGDIIVVNGALTGLSSADAVTWTATFTPAADITASSNVIGVNLSGVTDQLGTVGAGIATSNSFAIDTERPTVNVTLSTTAMMAGVTSVVTFTFSEPITDFTNADLVVPNGTLTPVTSADGGITWTATLTPNQGIRASTNSISLNLAGVVDLAGNSGIGTMFSPNYGISTVRPTASVTVSDSVLAIGETALVTVAFSERVSGFSNGDATAPGGTLSTFTSMDGGQTWTAIFTPTPNTSTASNAITIDLTGVANADGNAGAGTVSSNSFAIQTTTQPAGGAAGVSLPPTGVDVAGLFAAGLLLTAAGLATTIMARRSSTPPSS